MPTYDYVCDACDHKFELFQSIKDDPKKTCPECGKKKLRRLFGTGVAIVFKGSGFYATDYRSESYKQKASADKAESSGSTSTEAKPSEANKSTEKSTESKSSDSGTTGNNSSTTKKKGARKSKD